MLCNGVSMQDYDLLSPDQVREENTYALGVQASGGFRHLLTKNPERMPERRSVQERQPGKIY